MIAHEKKSGILGFALFLLVFAIALVIYGATRIPPPRFTATLIEILPPPPPGWVMKEKKIAESPEMQEAVGEILNFDDGAFVDYLSPGGDRLSVYIAHWTPGKMSHRLVAVHTPDVCWVGGGWIKTESGHTPDIQVAASANTSTHVIRIPRGEKRTFTANSVPEYVWFWHLVGDESKSYDTGSAPPWHSALTDLFSKGVNQREEQFFIRLSSNKPLESFWAGPALTSILAALPWPPARQL